MKMTKVDSTMINAIGYDPVTKITEIEFKNGKVYEYHDIHQDYHDALAKAESIGKHLNSVFKHHASKIIPKND
jgi:hypothetical protein